jgi:hypothetical protein
MARFRFQFSPSPKLSVRFDTPKRPFKRKARSLSLVTALFVGVSAPFFILYRTAKEIPMLAELLWMPYLWWSLHAVVTILALVFWIFERPAHPRIRHHDKPA